MQGLAAGWRPDEESCHKHQILHNMRLAGTTLAKQQQVMHSALLRRFGLVCIGLVADLSEAGHEQRLVFIESLVSWQFLHQVLDEGAGSGIDILLAEGTAVCRDVGQELMQEDMCIATCKNIVFQVLSCLWLELLLVIEQ